MKRRHRSLPLSRRSISLVLLLLLLPACNRDSVTAPTVTSSPSATLIAPAPSVTGTARERPVPSLPSAPLTPASTPTTSATPRAAREPGPAPDDQEEDLPDVRLSYEIEARLRDVESGIVDAVSIATITNQETASLERLDFRVAPAHDDQFSLNRLSRDGVAIEPVGSDSGTTLEIVLDPPLAPAATTIVRFDFNVPLRETGDGFASIGRDGQVFRLGYWYPMLSNDDGYPPLLDPPYTLTADYAVSFTAPAGVVVAASGELTGPPEESESGVRYRYTLDNGRDFALMLSLEYQVDERMTASGIVVRLYTLASQYGDSDTTRREIRERAFSAAERALADFQANIGPYPWPSLALVEAGPGLGGGIEYTALTLISYDSQTLDNLVAHETAHMWFYAAIGTRTQQDPWVDEGAATFLGNGISIGDYALSSDDGALDYVVPLGASVFELAAFNGCEWIAAVYTQGGSFYADTYVAMGETAFWRAMRAIYDTQGFAIATPWEILTIFQQYSDTDLLPIYERYFSYEWLDEVG